ncbi:unnamed protein product [Zymoseptoria tritici ST99CH_1A5]|uniref:Uncharacterized protein n=1 Tax=Zymoseptoria tritici ST99CH_1A5 TaxID=1276529 RepID=A0A1Y6LTL0_ZYMTR|nr:unnamed protein product [Zymoseptoria tritici ST99CH_1A5]
MPAITICRYCKRDGYVCRTYKDPSYKLTSYGYCFSYGKQGCPAGKALETDGHAGEWFGGIMEDIKAKLAAAEDDIELLTAANVELENKGNALLSEINLLKHKHSTEIGGLLGEIKLLKEKHVDVLVSYKLNQEELTTVREALEEKDAAIKRRLERLEKK